MLPDGDGIELCNNCKNRSSRTAVVIISARDDKESEIEALNLVLMIFIKNHLILIFYLLELKLD